MPKVYLVPAIRRAFEIIDLVAQAGTGVTISQVHRRLHLPLSSAATILYTLQSLGYVERDRDNLGYRLGLKLLSLSHRLDHMDLVGRCHDLLVGLVAESGLTGHLAVLRGNDSMYVDRVAGPGLIQFSSYIGMTWPAHSSGVGKALLAYLRPEELKQKLATIKLKQVTGKTIVSKSRLEKQLSKFRSLGYAWEMDEGEMGVGCVAAPVLGPEQVMAAASVTGTTQQIKSRISALGQIVKEYASEMSTGMGANLA
jgi:DNA-binding IclR family transcriptional regulator